MSEKYKTFMQRVYDEAFNNGNLSVIDETYAHDYFNNGNLPGLPQGIEGVKTLIRVYRAAFPDLHIQVEDQVLEGDKVVTRWTSTGTHHGDLMGIPATGNQVNLQGVDVNRFANDRFVEGWVFFDRLTMMQQLGVIPTPESA